MSRISHANKTRRTASSGASSCGAFGSMDVTAAAADLAKLHARVCLDRGRIEITRSGCDESCVLISRDELEALERALEILSTTDGAAAMRLQLRGLAAELRVEPIEVGN